MTLTTLRGALAPTGALGIAALYTLAACSAAPSAPATRYPVSLSVASVAASGGVAPPVGLSFSSVRLSIGQTSLGSGDQFGCQNCQDQNSDAAQSPPAAAVVSIPAAGGPVLLATERVLPGTYPQAEIDLVPPAGAMLGGSATNTIEITGSYRGAPFDVAFPVIGTFVQSLSPPTIVGTSTSQSLSATITLPLASWFSANGTALDPGNPIQRARIEANIRTFVTAESAAVEPD